MLANFGRIYKKQAPVGASLGIERKLTSYPKPALREGFSLGAGVLVPGNFWSQRKRPLTELISEKLCIVCAEFKFSFYGCCLRPHLIVTVQFPWKLGTLLILALNRLVPFRKLLSHQKTQAGGHMLQKGRQRWVRVAPSPGAQVDWPLHTALL